MSMTIAEISVAERGTLENLSSQSVDARKQYLTPEKSGLEFWNNDDDDYGVGNDDDNNITATPTRVWSSPNLLVGEDLLVSSRPESREMDAEFSPFTPCADYSPAAIPRPINLPAKTKGAAGFQNADDRVASMTRSVASSQQKARNDLVDRLPSMTQSVASSQQKARNDLVGRPTRPPRAPQHLLQMPLNPRRDSTRHRRVNSDISNLSALTDSSWGSHSHSRRQRRRALSLDGNETLDTSSSHKSTPLTTLLQPILADEPPTSIFTPFKAEGKPRTKRKHLIAHFDVSTRSRGNKQTGSFHGEQEPDSRLQYERRPLGADRPSGRETVDVYNDTTAPSRLGVADILSAYPREDEDETALLEILEERKPERTLLQSMIFPNVGKVEKYTTYQALFLYTDPIAEGATQEAAPLRQTKTTKLKVSYASWLYQVYSGYSNSFAEMPSVGYEMSTRMKESEFCVESLARFLGSFAILLASLSTISSSRDESESVPFTTFATLFPPGLLRHFAGFLFARFAEELLFDRLVLEEDYVSAIIGSRAVFVLIQSKGWPFRMGIWALVDILLQLLQAYFGDSFLSITSIRTMNGDFYLCIACIVISTIMKRSLIGQLVYINVIGRYKKETDEMLRKLLLLKRMHEYLEMKEGDPNVQVTNSRKIHSMSSTILQFRSSASILQDILRASNSFAMFQTREGCINQAEELYERLAESSNGVLFYNHLCTIVQSGGDNEKNSSIMNDLDKVFYPNTSSEMMSKLDFVKSIDRLYKSTHVLMASIDTALSHLRPLKKSADGLSWLLLFVFITYESSSKVITFIRFILGLFMVLLVFISLDQLKGGFFIFMRYPFDIGDRIALNLPPAPTDTPCTGWIVEKMDFLTTTLRSGSTFETVLVPNRTLANATIVNLRRSVPTQVCIRFKFCTGASRSQIVNFRRMLENFTLAKEWNKIISFRPVEVNSDLDYVEYAMILQHEMPSWQNLTAILVSKSDVVAYATRIQMQMGIKKCFPRVLSSESLCADPLEENEINLKGTL